MSFRKSVILRRILLHFASPMQIKRYDELAAYNKGSASHAALRLIEDYFENKNKPYLVEEKRENAIKINHWNKSL